MERCFQRSFASLAKPSRVVVNSCYPRPEVPRASASRSTPPVVCRSWKLLEGVFMEGTQWWRTAVIYEVYVRSFADGNGDGTGDLVGLRRRLPYLRDLGVDAVWLTPFYRSPMIDGGYDVADYRDVDPSLGTLADFDTMLAAAHGLGL